MKILMLNYEYPPLGGGAANATYYMLKEFSLRNDIEVDLITSSANSKFEIEKMGANVVIHKLPISKNKIHYWTQKEILSYSWKAYRYIKKLNLKEYDLAHAFFGIPCGGIAWAFRKNLPYIVSLRGSDVPGFNNRFSFQYVFLKPIIKKVWRDSGAVIANSKGLKELALKTEEYVDIGIIFNGITIDQFFPKVDSQNEHFTVLTVARLIERKRIEDLIKAVSLLVKDNITNIKVKIIGDGNMRGQLESLAQNLNVSEYIEFLGYIPHEKLPSYYSSSDLFVLPSKNEGMSNTILEAMASGLPIITTNTGGTQELISGNGILVGAENPKSIKEALNKYFDNHELLREHGQKSREIAENMSWGKVAQDYYKAYQAIQ